MASARDYDLEKKRWRWTYHLFRAVVAACILYVAGTQILEHATRSVAQPPPPPIVEPPPAPDPPPPPPVVEAPPQPPPPAPEPEPPAPPPPQAAQAPRPTFRVPGQSINGRAGPGTDFRIVRRVTGDLLLVSTGETQNDWIEVFVRGGPEDQRFWVFRTLVRPAEQ